MKITLKIGDDIVVQDATDNGVFESFTYKLNSIQDDLEERDEKARNEFTFTGKITNENSASLYKILLWSMERENTRRTIEIKVVDSVNNKDKALRIFKFSEVFCIDYSETYSKENKSKTKFELFLAQSPQGKKHEVTTEITDDID
ncbi:MAG: hypothetical protein K5979_13115 [Ruminococcus sp.]|nr:hypothetical protein [Ruminococcus sp.]